MSERWIWVEPLALNRHECPKNIPKKFQKTFFEILFSLSKKLVWLFELSYIKQLLDELGKYKENIYASISFNSNEH